MLVLVIAAIVLFFVWFFVLRKFKVPKVNALSMFTGGVKTGKSAVSLYFAVKHYKKRHRAWRVRCFFCKIFRREKPEEPLFYSNIPLRYIKYCPVTQEHFLRKVRFNFGSVVFIDEASLVADNWLTKDMTINNELLLFFKLFGHETHGGLCFINSQAISDLHYALKRCTSSYFYIHHLGWFPFFRIPLIREERYSEDVGAGVRNVYNDDVEGSLRKVLMSARIFKKYDSYCFSFFTDGLPVKNEEKLLGKEDDLKVRKVVSFRPTFRDLKAPEQFVEVEEVKEDA